MTLRSSPHDGLGFACSEPYLSPAISDSVHLEISEIAKHAFSDEGRSKAAMCTNGNSNDVHNALPEQVQLIWFTLYVLKFKVFKYDVYYMLCYTEPPL